MRDTDGASWRTAVGVVIGRRRELAGAAEKLILNGIHIEQNPSPRTQVWNAASLYFAAQPGDGNAETLCGDVGWYESVRHTSQFRRDAAQWLCRLTRRPVGYAELTRNFVGRLFLKYV